jgi:CheY-like chemotaxis protein
MKILAVDDDASIRMLLKNALTPSENYDLTVVCSAKEALETIDRARSTFDCFLIDIQMPGVNGIDLTKVIRQSPAHAHKPILMLTAMHDKGYMDRAFMAGATDYVSKPFDFKDLYSRIFDAQKLTLEKARLVDRVNIEHNIKWSLGVAKDTVLDHSIGQADADGLIAYGEFDNYLLEFARRPQRKAAVIAAKIAAPILGHVEISLNEFSAILREVTLCVRASFPDIVTSMSYRGNGTLLCVIEQQSSASREMIENEINGRFSAASINANSLKVRIFLGDAIPLRANSDAGVLDVMWSAIESVERRVVLKRENFTISKRLLNRGRLSEEQHRLERKAYKSVMKDILPEMNDDSWLQKLYSRAGRQKSP